MCKNFHHIQFDHHAKFGCCFSYSDRACRRSQKFGEGTLGPRPLGTEVWLIAHHHPVKKIPHSSITMQNLVAVLCVRMEELKNSGTLGVADLETCLRSSIAVNWLKNACSDCKTFAKWNEQEVQSSSQRTRMYYGCSTDNQLTRTAETSCAATCEAATICLRSLQVVTFSGLWGWNLLCPRPHRAGALYIYDRCLSVSLSIRPSVCHVRPKSRTEGRIGTFGRKKAGGLWPHSARGQRSKVKITRPLNALT